MHAHYTRNTSLISSTASIKHQFAEKCIQNVLIFIHYKQCFTFDRDKFYTYSLNGYLNYSKQYLINNYPPKSKHKSVIYAIFDTDETVVDRF